MTMAGKPSIVKTEEAQEEESVIKISPEGRWMEGTRCKLWNGMYGQRREGGSAANNRPQRIARVWLLWQERVMGGKNTLLSQSEEPEQRNQGGLRHTLRGSRSAERPSGQRKNKGMEEAK